MWRCVQIMVRLPKGIPVAYCYCNRYSDTAQLRSFSGCIYLLVCDIGTLFRAAYVVHDGDMGWGYAKSDIRNWNERFYGGHGYGFVVCLRGNDRLGASFAR